LVALRIAEIAVKNNRRTKLIAFIATAFYFAGIVAAAHAIMTTRTAPGAIASVGTPNFDNRSFRLNFEVTALIVDKDFASQMEAMFEADFAHSVIIDPASFDKKPL